MRGAILSLPHTSSWHVAWLSTEICAFLPYSPDMEIGRFHMPFYRSFNTIQSF